MCYAIPPEVDYSKVCCPETEKACYEEAVWIFQNTMLGTKEDMNRFAEAIIKIQKAYGEEKHAENQTTGNQNFAQKITNQ